MNNFNERLKLAMDLKKISQSELCEKTGIPKSAMSQYVSGAFVPKQERTYLIAKALNVNESWLLGFDDVSMDRGEQELTSNEREMIEIFKDLTETQQGELIGRAKVMQEHNRTEAEALEKEKISG